jgi:hypothetical protein
VIAAAVAWWLVAWSLAACGSAASPVSPAPASGAPAGTATAPAGGSAAPTPAASPSAAVATRTPTGTPTRRAAPPTFGVIEVEGSLLDFLPATVDGVPLTPDPQTAAQLALDPNLADVLASVAIAAVFGPIATDATGDYAVATVARLRPDVFSDAFFRDWRDSFDAAVCDQAGGVAGHAESVIGGHPVWIGTCAGGVHTYHATLGDGEVIVSLQSAGDRRYGEQVVAGLTG